MDVSVTINFLKFLKKIFIVYFSKFKNTRTVTILFFGSLFFLCGFFFFWVYWSYSKFFNLFIKNGESALHYCCRCNNQESAKEIIEFLISNGISINSQNRNGESALHIATRYGCIEIAKYLCKLGINLDFQDDVIFHFSSSFLT